MKEISMKNKFKIYGIYMLIYLLALPTLVSLGAVACINHLGTDGYFDVTTVANIANVALTAVSFFLLTYVFFSGKEVKLIPSFSSPLNYAPCAIVSASLAFISVHLFIEADIMGKENFNGFTLAVAIAALLAVLYFVIAAISVKRRSIMRSDLGIIVLVFLCLYIAYIFFDMKTPVNAPIKIATMMAYLSFSVFFLYETRLSLGREKWRPYVAFSFISSLTCAYASIPALIVYCIDGREIGISIYETILVFSFFVFSTFKLFLVGELVPERGSDIVNKLIASANERISELTPTIPESETIETDENQISILDGVEDGDIVNDGTSTSETAPEEVSAEEAITTDSKNDVIYPKDEESDEFITANEIEAEADGAENAEETEPQTFSEEKDSANE